MASACKPITAKVMSWFVEAEGDAQNQDDLANQLEHTGKGKNDGITKLFNAIGSVPAVKYHAEAAKYRAEAARLREELAKIENQDKFSAGVPTP